MNTLADFWPQGLLTLALIFICGLLMLVILIQKGRGGGLSGACGGGGGGSAAFGTKTGDVFTWITIALASLFLFVTVLANFAFDQSVTSVAAAPAVPVAAPTATGEAVDIGDLPDAFPLGGGLEEEVDADLADPVDSSADDGAAEEAPPAEVPPVEDPPATGTESSQESDEGGTPTP